MKTIKILFFALLCGFVIFSCNGKIEKNKPISTKPTINKVVKTPVKVIQILPLGYVHPDYITEVKSAIKKFYGYDSNVLPSVDFTNDIIAASGVRLDAGKILDKYTTTTHRLIITERDIAYNCPERDNREWGIFGLSYISKPICVISTFRLNRCNGKFVPIKQLYDRIDKIALHEIGHNLGLDHCSTLHCMMSPAGGSIKEVDEEKIWFCDQCKARFN